MIKLITIVGARPQIIKSAAISRAIANKFSDRIEEVLLHTGQHYDQNMSQVFFDELRISEPKYNLAMGSGEKKSNLETLQSEIEEIVKVESPQAIVVYGDTNSTLAGSRAAAALTVPLIHIEAGLRSFNNDMPEEQNRIIADQMATYLFSPTKIGIQNLTQEGFPLNATPPFSPENPKVYHCGDIMYDNSLYFNTFSVHRSNIIEELGLTTEFVFATLHRNVNTDNAIRLNNIFTGLLKIIEEFGITIVLPLHPRTKKMMDAHLKTEIRKEIEAHESLRIIPPASYLDVIALEKNAELIITDSGGVQREAYYFKKPALVLRDETEWVELVESGHAVLCDDDVDLLLTAYKAFQKSSKVKYPRIFGDGNAAIFICEEICKQLI